MLYYIALVENHWLMFSMWYDAIAYLIYTMIYLNLKLNTWQIFPRCISFLLISYPTRHTFLLCFFLLWCAVLHNCLLFLRSMFVTFLLLRSEVTFPWKGPLLSFIYSPWRSTFSILPALIPPHLSSCITFLLCISSYICSNNKPLSSNNFPIG